MAARCCTTGAGTVFEFRRVVALYVNEVLLMGARHLSVDVDVAVVAQCSSMTFRDPEISSRSASTNASQVIAESQAVRAASLQNFPP